MSTNVTYQRGLLTVADMAVFHRGRPRLAQALIEELAASTAVLSACIDLDAGTCRVQFEGTGSEPSKASQLFVAALQAARQPQSRRLFARLLPRQQWSTLLAHRVDDGPVVFRIQQTRPDLIEFRVVAAPVRPAPKDRILDAVGACSGIRALRLRRWPAGLDVEFDPDVVNRDQVLDIVAEAWSASPSPPVATATTPRVFMVRGPRRLLYLAAGCGSFVMSIVGLLVPGVPTVPFLLASSYYFARSSHNLHRRLLESRFFGQMLREWETHRAMSRSSKQRLASFTVIIILVTVAIAPLSPVLVLAVAVMSVISLYGIGRIPELDQRLDAPLSPAIAAC